MINNYYCKLDSTYVQDKKDKTAQLALIKHASILEIIMKL